MIILGVNDHHNASACLLKDGKILYAMQEERFVRSKNFWGTPKKSVDSVLEHSGISYSDVDLIVFAGKSHAGKVNFSRKDQIQVFKDSIQMDIFDTIRGRNSVSIWKVAKRKVHVVLRSLFPKWFYRKTLLDSQSKRIEIFHSYFPKMQGKPYEFIDHHECHFSTAYYGEKHRERPVLVFTNDGQGDRLCATVSLVDSNGNRELLSTTDDHNSVGSLWAIITLMMGFVPLEHEYKLMGMAPYADNNGSQKVANILHKLLAYDDGNFSYKKSNIQSVLNMQPVIEELQKMMKFTRFDDICGGLQIYTEKVLTEWVSFWIDKTGVHDIALSGGTFMNIKSNMEIMKLDKVESVFVFPSCGDETNAIGACYSAWNRVSVARSEPIKNFYLGRNWNDSEYKKVIDKIDDNLFSIALYEDIELKIAKILAKGGVVARFKGREEFGARSLGNRSILANPSKWSSVGEINDMIKQRDFWMPFACSILDSMKEKYVKNLNKTDGRYMIMGFEGGNDIDKIVAGTHPKDHTVRPQFVTKESAPDYCRLIENFKDITGIGAVLNTSFNLHGYPLVHSPSDAVEVLSKSGLKYLALGNYLISKRVKNG